MTLIELEEFYHVCVMKINKKLITEKGYRPARLTKIFEFVTFSSNSVPLHIERNSNVYILLLIFNY